MARIITKEHAVSIARKLKAEIRSRKGSPHDLALVTDDDGVLIATFGIRRASEKDKGHDHIPKDLHVGPRDARNLALCPLSREEWIRLLKEKGVA